MATACLFIVNWKNANKEAASVPCQPLILHTCEFYTFGSSVISHAKVIWCLPLPLWCILVIATWAQIQWILADHLTSLAARHLPGVHYHEWCSHECLHAHLLRHWWRWCTHQETWQIFKVTWAAGPCCSWPWFMVHISPSRSIVSAQVQWPRWFLFQAFKVWNFRKSIMTQMDSRYSENLRDGCILRIP